MIGPEFENIEPSKILPGLATVKAMKFTGPLEQAISMFGRPRTIHLALSTDARDPEWRALYHAAWPTGAKIYGGFDPSAFIYLRNASIDAIDEIELRFHIEEEVEDGKRSTIYLSPSFQPCRMTIGSNGKFETASLFLISKPPEQVHSDHKSQKPPARGFFNVKIVPSQKKDEQG